MARVDFKGGRTFAPVTKNKHIPQNFTGYIIPPEVIIEAVTVSDKVKKLIPDGEIYLIGGWVKGYHRNKSADIDIFVKASSFNQLEKVNLRRLAKSLKGVDIIFGNNVPTPNKLLRNAND